MIHALSCSAELNTFWARNGSPMAMNVVVFVVVFVVVGTCYCYQIFNLLKLLHFATDRKLQIGDSILDFRTVSDVLI